MLRNIILICFTTLFIGCSNVDSNKRSVQNISNFSELFQVAYEYRNDSLFYNLCNRINDSVVSKGSYFGLSSWIDVNIETKNVDWCFLEHEGRFPHFTQNNCFIIEISDKDTILVDGNVAKIEEIKTLAEMFYNKLDTITGLKKVVEIDFFGKVSIPNTLNVLIIKINKKRKLADKQWKIFYNSLAELMQFYENKRDKIAEKKWGRSYEKLKYEEKIAINQMVNFGMYIIFVTYNGPN